MSKLEVRSALLFSALILGTAFTAQAGQTRQEQQVAPPCKAAVVAQDTARARAPASKLVSKPAATQVTMSATAPSQRRVSSAQAAFNRADLNGDSKLSRSETRQFPVMTQRFKQIDTNRDNLLTFEELIRAVSGNV